MACLSGLILASAQYRLITISHSSRFWKLLHESELVSEPLTYHEDGRLPEWRLGLIKISNRGTAGIDARDPVEYRQGVVNLKRRINAINLTSWPSWMSRSFECSFPPGNRRKAHFILERLPGNWAERGSFFCRIRAAAMRIIPIARCS